MGLRTSRKFSSTSLIVHSLITTMCDVISLSFVTGYFWHVDSLHLDVNYTIEGDRHKCEQNCAWFSL